MNVPVAAGNCFIISSGDLVLDFDGYTLNNTAGVGNVIPNLFRGTAVRTSLPSGAGNIVISDGKISHFSSGIRLSSVSNANVSGMNISRMYYAGIELSDVSNSVFRDNIICGYNSGIIDIRCPGGSNIGNINENNKYDTSFACWMWITAPGYDHAC